MFPPSGLKIFFSSYNKNVDVIQAIFDTKDLAPELKLFIERNKTTNYLLSMLTRRSSEFRRFNSDVMK